MADINTVATQFTQYYYNSFDADRRTLAPLYRPTSMLSFEGAQTLGAEAIIEKLANLPFRKVQHRVLTTDAQPAGNDLFIAITGQLLIDEESHPTFFSQSFLLKPEGGSYYIQNDIFRLNLG